uniref:K Homology domain-containing protein n=1 Tax=Heliothis virescens TaxID=7102 RepID=A0A2A4JTK0_HELVI
MQNVGQSENRNIDKVNVQLDVVKSSTPQSSASSPAKSETETYSGAPAKYMTDSSESEDESVSEAEMEEEGGGAEPSKFLLSHDDPERAVDPEMEARLEALLQAAGIGKLSGEGKHLADPEVLRRLTSSVSCALDEAAAALTRMRSDQPPPHHRHHHQDKNQQCGSSATGTTPTVASSVGADGAPSLAEACSDGDVGTVRKLLTEGRSVHETTEEGESLLSLACSAGYYELAQVLLAMHASVEDRGIKGDCTPLMEAASAGHVDIVRLLIAHHADVNAVSGSGNTPLMYACAGGHEECVRALLESGANVEDHNENGHTPLMEAASAGHVGVAKILLEHGAGINTHSNEFKESALTLACYKGHLDMVRFLLAAGADREHKTDEMHTALMEASMDGHVEVARLLLDSGAQVNMPTDSFESPLTLAACGGHVELAMLLLERGANIEEVNDEGYTPLMEAAREGHEEMVALLLGQGASINAQTEETQETALTLACCGGFLEVADFLIKAGADAELGASTPLMEASQEGHLELVRYLLNAGADVNAQTQTGDTALTYACENGHTDVADLLLRAGAELEHESEGGRTPLMKACRAGHVCTVQFLVGKGADASMDGHVEVARLLLDSGAQVNMPTDSFESPLTLAACGGHVELAMLLLERGANIEEVNDEGYTPLMEAAREGHEEMVALLLGQGASINAQTEETQETALTLACCGGFLEVADFLIKAGADAELGASTPLMEASQEGHLELVRYLLNAGADVNAQTQTGDTALTYACENGHTDVADLLLRAGAELEHESEGGRTPLMKACRAGHVCTVQFLVGKGADVNRMTALGDHTPLSLACAGGHVDVVKFLLACDADPFRKLKDNSTMLIEAAKGGHTAVVQLLLDYPHSDLPTKFSKVYLDVMTRYDDHGVRRRESPTDDTLLQRDPRDCLPEADRSLLDLPDPAGPPTLATSALHALDLQFCAQGVTTIHPPTTPPYPPPQQLFPVQQLATNLNQNTPIQERPRAKVSRKCSKFGCKFLLLDALQRLGQHISEVGAVAREVPSLVALPPNELRSLVLQKSHEILSSKCAEAEGERGADGEGHERHARRLLEEALTADWPRQDHHHHHHHHHHHVDVTASNGCQFRVRPSSPSGNLESGIILTRADNDVVTLPQSSQAPPPQQPQELQPHFALPPPTLPYEEYGVASSTTLLRTATFAPPHAGTAGAAAAAPLAPQPHAKREQPHHHNNASVAAKKKGRFAGTGRGCRSGEAYGTATPPAPAPAAYCAMDVDGETDSNHDTALTLACAGGHEDLVELLLSRGADIEHRDKKGFTPLILAATAGHEKIVEILLNHGADIEAQSERTKDTPLSLACSGGRYEVVELILSRGANKEHRNVSDYTPLSLAASGGYVNIIRLLLTHQAEINSRTGSKLGISPLMLAAMNGHTAAVRLLLDCGSDINAQIETNRNTALTLACFQGRHEVVSLLLDRKANVEHRAKTGLTPLMEAASGGYVEVGRVLLDKGADVNAPPVPSSRDTALTIAADKGHTKFVELLLQRRAAVEVKNKKGNSPLWLAANGGHLAVVEMLYAAGADIDSQDNRKVSCLMAAFRKGHTKVVKWMVGVVTQFPSDQEMTRYICTISDKDLLEKCQECVRSCMQEERRKLQAENDKNSLYCDKALGDCSEGGEPDDEPVPKEEGDSGIDANSQGSCSSSDVKAPPVQTSKSKKKKKDEKAAAPPPPAPPAKKQPDKSKPKIETKPEKETTPKPDKKQEKENVAPSSPPATPAKPAPPPERRPADKKDKKPEEDNPKSITVQNVNKYGNNSRKSQVFESTRHNVDKDDVDTSDKNKKTHNTHQWETEGKSTSPKGGCVGGRREEGWKEVVRKSSVQTLSTVEPGCKKVSVASHAISRVIGRAGSNINAIRSATGAHIEVDKQSKGQGERIITIKGSAEATKQAGMLIAAMIRDPEADIVQLLPRAVTKPPPQPLPLQPKTPKQPPPKQAASSSSSSSASSRTTPTARAPAKQHVRPAPPRLQPHTSTAEKRAPSTSSVTLTVNSGVKASAALSYTGAIVGARPHTFAAKLTAAPAAPAPPPPAPADLKPRPAPQPSAPSSSPGSSSQAGAASPQKARDASPPPPAAPPTLKQDDADKPHRLPDRTVQLSPDNSSSWSANEENTPNTSSALHINTTPQQSHSRAGGQEYSLFKDLSAGAAAVWGASGDATHNVDPPPPQVDASKAPGYRGTGGGAGAGGGCSPCSRTSSHGSTPPPAYAPALHQPVQPYHQPLPLGNNVNAMDMSGLSRNGPIYQDNSRNGHNMMQQVSISSGVNMSGAALGLGYVGVESVSRLNPRAPDFAQRHPLMQQKHNAQLFAGASNAGNLSALLMSYQQQPMNQSPKPMQHTPQQQHHAYQSLLERGVGGVGGWGGGEEEERKPRPIGTERAWKLTAADDWPHAHLHHPHHADHDRYQGVSGMGHVGHGMEGGAYGGVGAGGATAAALSLMHALPLHYLPAAPPPEPHAHWEPAPHQPDKQAWSKWTH